MLRNIILIAVVAVIGVVVAFNLPVLTGEKKGEAYTQAPDFMVRDIITNNQLKLSDYKGKVTLIRFWVTWCPECKAEVPSVTRMYQHYDGQVAIIAVAKDHFDQQNVIDYAKKHNMTLFDVAMDTDEISKNYKVNATPTTVVLDKKGRIIDTFVGKRDWDSAEYHAYLDKLIAQK